ncbi:RHS repeat domain-containing protein [Odoribacter laneus]|uniref:RHS repeat domain-containing protein n=1 Tax=Odoribacter laneus TaxID=626933 RepID=UPI0023F34F4E|nr:DUF6443 domain-containing protein [Odoribacter laneus]
MKNTIFLILSLLFFYTTTYSGNPGKAEGLKNTDISFISFPDIIVVPPAPVQPPQCLRVGKNNLLLIPAGQRQYQFKLDVIPSAENFIADNLPGIIQWVKSGNDSAPVETPDSDFWKPITEVPLSEGEIVFLADEDAEYTQPDQPVEPPVDPPMESMQIEYTLEHYADTKGQILQLVTKPGSLENTLTFKENVGYAEIEGTLRISYHVHVVIGKNTADFTREMDIKYRLINRNYVLEKIVNAKNDGYHSTVTYYDGLGRKEQEIAVNASPSGQDIITPFYYDAAGRNSRVYLPYAAEGSGKYQSTIFDDQRAFYNARYSGDPYTYSEFRFNGRGQVIRNSIPGAVWSIDGEHTTRTVYRKNTLDDKVKKYVLNDNSVTFTQYYPEGSLSVKEVWDPENHVFLEYTDINQQIIARENRISSQKSLFTYDLYDDLGRKRCIITPLRDAEFTISTKELSELQSDCYCMDYDEYGRLYKQYIPGAGYTINLYDRRERLACTQDALQREKGEWSFTKYDELDRPVITGICQGTESGIRELLDTQGTISESRGGNMHGYTNLTYPIDISPDDCLTVTYYDDYRWPEQEIVAYSEKDGLNFLYQEEVMGQITGTKTRVLGDTSVKWLLQANYYNLKNRNIQSVSQLYPTGMEVVTNLYNFKGDVVRAIVKQTIGNECNEYNKYFEYNNRDDLSCIRYEITGDTVNRNVKVIEYAYDEIGRKSSCKLHDGAEEIHYSYHIAGMLTAAVAAHFSYNLDYEEINISGATPRYDKNINAVRWKYGNEKDQAYIYEYDPLKYLVSAHYLEKRNEVWQNSLGSYNVQGLTYDDNGNLTRLKRYGSDGSLMNDLVYHYNNLQNRNVITKITDKNVNSSEYIYDKLGNMIFDGRREVNISYNLLNLPYKINKDSENIIYIYSASGEKLAQKKGSSFTYYRHVMVYEGDKLSYIMHPQGFVRKSNNDYLYSYLLMDHLGSSRVLLEAVNDSLIAVQQTDYYPFGKAFEHHNLNRNKYLYSGKEFQDISLGGSMLSLYDFGARYYDPEIGRWFNVDPALQLISPYGYCGNNPIQNIDPDGEFMLGFITGMFRGIFKGHFKHAKFLKEAVTSGYNELKITVGLFKAGGGQNFFGMMKEIVSRFTWQLPQTLLGFTYANAVNYLSDTKVDYYGGATTVSTPLLSNGQGVTLGSFITGGKDLEADPANPLFQHEYGHYLQSQKIGINYIWKVAVPSFLSVLRDRFRSKENKRHKYTSTEQDANSRAIKYFYKRNVLKWNFEQNPIGNENQWDMKNIMDKNGQFTFLFERALDAALMGHRSSEPLSERGPDNLHQPITF